MKIAGRIALVVLVVIGVLVVCAAMKPAQYLVSREMVMKAKPEQIFPHLNNSKKANDWMPWKEADPTAPMTYTGPEEGVGATTSWDSKGKMGTGKAEVVDTTPNKSVKTKITYTKPMQMNQLAEISLTPTPEGTTVKWTVTGENSFFGRFMCMFFDMDKMVGGLFEKGLSSLKSRVEAH